jgi:hypothetical protein
VPDTPRQDPHSPEAIRTQFPFIRQSLAILTTTSAALSFFQPHRAFNSTRSDDDLLETAWKSQLPSALGSYLLRTLILHSYHFCIIWADGYFFRQLFLDVGRGTRRDGNRLACCKDGNEHGSGLDWRSVREVRLTTEGRPRSTRELPSRKPVLQTESTSPLKQAGACSDLQGLDYVIRPCPAPDSSANEQDVLAYCI